MRWSTVYLCKNPWFWSANWYIPLRGTHMWNICQAMTWSLASLVSNLIPPHYPFLLGVCLNTDFSSLGLLNKQTGNQQVIDPVCDEFFENVWNQTASTNSVIYDELFSVIPTNSIPTLKASRDLQTKARPLVETFGRDVRNKLVTIQGHLVIFPTEYLSEEDLQPAGLAKEGIVPQEMWKWTRNIPDTFHAASLQKVSYCLIFN